MSPLYLLFALALFGWSAGPGHARADEAPPSAASARVEERARSAETPASNTEQKPAAPDSAAAGAPPSGERTKEAAQGGDTHAAAAPSAGAEEKHADTPAGTAQAEQPGAAPAPATSAPAASAPAAAEPAPAKPPAKTSSSSRPKAKPPTAAANGAKAAKAPEPAPEQGPAAPSESDRVTRELARTDRAIALAKRRVDVSKNGRARKTVASALDFQSDAREAFKVRQYARSERLTLAAREYADRAARMVGPPREDPEYVETVLRRTDDALDRARDVMRNGAGPQTWRRHEALKESQKGAWKALKDGEVGDAYNRSLAVRQGVLDLLRELDDLPVPRETAEKAINGARAALERAGKDLGAKPPGDATRFIRLANTYIDKAQDSYNHRSYRAALLQAKVAERNLEKAIDAARPRT